VRGATEAGSINNKPSELFSASVLIFVLWGWISDYQIWCQPCISIWTLLCICKTDSWSFCLQHGRGGRWRV